MKRRVFVGAICLSVGLLTVMCGAWARSSHASVLAGVTPTPTSTPTPTTFPSPRPSPPPPAQASLNVVKAAQESRVTPGGLVTYTIVVENPSSATATGVMLLDDAPPQLEVIAASVSQGEVTVEGDQVTADVGVLGPGYSSTLTITARIRFGVGPNVQIENIVLAWSDQTGEIVSSVVITVVGLLPESGQGTTWLAIALAVLGAGLACLGLFRKRWAA